ncbi:MAG: amino acid adenylation domain-containing protein [Nostocaceae cyanobacterium]|nr:amino acid adenylation domain-containing protein [Nostocaceae cyanobacterium]
MEVYVFPLAHAQKRLWYQEIIQPGNIAYNIPIALRLSGEVNFHAIESAWDTIINRHEILRTTFAIEDGEPVQLIHAEMALKIEKVKIESTPEANLQETSKEKKQNQEEVLNNYLTTASCQPFDLVKGPLIRVILYEISEQEHILFVNMHHIISDGWSLGILVQEFTQIYTGYLQRNDICLPELPIQYVDYSQWQEEWLKEDEGIQKQFAYWEEILAAPLPILDLPLDKVRPTKQTFNGAVVRELLPNSLTQSLEKLAMESDATFFMIALAVYQVLLFRYTGQTDIIVGTPIANRQQVEVENLIGFFVNTLPLRGNLDGKPSFRQFLRRTVQTCLDAYAHQDVPLEMLVEKLESERDQSRSPIFQTLFAVQNAPLGKIDLPGLTAIPIRLDNGGAKFDITLILEPDGDNWLATLEYNTDLLREESAQQMLRHFQQLLTAVVTNPDICIDALPLLSQNERQQLLTFGSASAPITQPTNLVDWFSQSVRIYGDRVAVKAGEKKLTYQELDQHSQKLADFLQKQGVGRETRVGIFQERDEDLIVSILAVLKAGGTYVPLDPVYPEERLRWIMEDSGVTCIITKSELVDSIPANDAEVIVIDKIDFGVCGEGFVSQEIRPDQAAYIIYTSGSTGKPKGCVIPHRNVTRLFQSTEPWFGFTHEDVWTLFHSFAFDFSVWEIWGALLYGGKVVVVPYLESRSPEAFWTLLQNEGVTILNQTPSAFRQLIRVEGGIGNGEQEIGNSQSPPSSPSPLSPPSPPSSPSSQLRLRAVIFGGEALELQSLRPWIEKYGDKSPRLINMYGITETTVHVTYRPIELKDIEENSGSVIGVPIPDLSLYILDEQLEPVPLGVRGEIYVGGMGVSRGYLNRPQLTAQRFVPDPFSPIPGARLYRTGDLARRLRNGDLEYLGRIDNQVKVRGFRIELGEIEAALAAIPQVSETLVITYSQSEDDKRLVAYVVPGGVSLEPSQLRTSLKESLPDYMIPAAFVILEEMPLTAQGKIDRKALPAPDWSHGAARRSLVLPESPQEKVICQVWEQVLGIDAVGVEDNYFELGGDSILALQVVTQMRRQGWEVKVKDIFAQQSVKDLALVINRLESVAPVAEDVRGEVPLVPIQKWFFDLNLANPNHWNQAVLLEVNQSVDVAVIEKAIRTVCLHHDVFRLRFQQQGDGWRQFYSEAGVENDWGLLWETIDLREKKREEQDVAMGLHCDRLQGSLDLSNGPLAGAILFQLGEKRASRLLIVIHHLIVDGVSFRIFLEDLGDAIEGRSLAPSTSSWQRWSNFLQSFVYSKAIQEEEKFWLAMIKDTQFQLPLDFGDRTSNLESSVRTIALELTEGDTNILLTEAHKAYHTSVEELLVAALSRTIANWTGGEVLQVMMESHGREELSNDVQLSRTLGWFTSLYPLRVDVSLCDDYETLLIRVKEQMRAVPRRGLGYGLLRYLQDQEGSDELTIKSAGDISFNYLGQVRSGDGKGNDLLRLVENEDMGYLHDPQGLRPHVLDVIAIVVAGKLQINWLYSSDLHHPETIARWGEDFRQNLLGILRHCTQPGVERYTPSDFPLIHLEQSYLDRLSAKFPNLEDIYSLSPMQEGMLFHTVYSPEDGVYFEQVTGRISGVLDIAAFNLAWQTVVERHPVLRTAFVWSGQKQAVQVVNRDVEFGVVEFDWCDLSPESQEEELNRYLDETRKQGFVLESAPLMSFAIMRLDDCNSRWVWNHHHILVDGWSLPVLFGEVLTIYQSILKGVAPTLAPVPPYRNYIQWLASRDEEEAQQFWRECLGGLDKRTGLLSNLPQDEEVGEKRVAYEKVDLRLREEEFASVQKMARSQGLTLNTLAQGAWALILQKYGAGEDVLFGVTVSGRPPELADVENMVGLFINTLPLRVRLNPAQNVADWLGEVQQRHLQMRDYEYSKLTDIHQWIGFAAGEPLFESILIFENYPIDKSLSSQGEELRVEDIQFFERTNYPLTIAFVPDEGLILRLNYETKFLSRRGAEELLEELRDVLLQLSVNPGVSLGNIQVASRSEEQLAIESWNDNYRSWGEFRLAHQLFEDQVDVNRNRTAVVCGGEVLTYGELEVRANLLAEVLQGEGVGNEDIIGLYFAPGIDFIVALLAVLKAGSAFVPLDPNYPQERLELILQDSQPRLILSSKKGNGEQGIGNGKEGTFNISCFQCLKSSKVMDLSTIDWTRKGEEGIGNRELGIGNRELGIGNREGLSLNLNLETRSSHLAYVIYTSGSTGKPKGVLVTHKGIQNLVRSQISTFGVTESSRVYQFASLSFDAAISEIFMALGSGASLYLKSPEHLPGPELWSTLTGWGITHLTLPPSLLAVIKPEELPCLQSLIVAGEAAALSLFQRWSTPGRRVFNAYGPTEATVCASMMNAADFSNQPSIGRAIANGEMYLLDANLQVVKPGVPGEIYIGGVGLARGYLNQPGLSAAAFVPHPFASEPGMRLYRTGDIGVYDWEGNIHYVGREDNRVKFHGHRIELGEIEAALVDHPGVDNAVVLLRSDVPGRERLVGYVVLGEGEEVSPGEFLQYLSGKLPGYMVPSAVVVVAEFPLTVNGKIDRKALPVPEVVSSSGDSLVREVNETEEILAKIWAEVLGLETVHVDDNFFAVGGDSIVSLQIVSRAREAGLDIRPQDIFAAPILYQLAALAKPFNQSVEVVEPLTGGVSLAPIQRWFFAQNLRIPYQWNQALAIRVNDELDVDALRVALLGLVNHHDALRLGFKGNGELWEQFYAGPGVAPSLRIKNFGSYPYDLQAYALQLVVEEEQSSFRLDSPPLLRVLYAKNLEEYGNVLYLFAHHLVVDGVSWRILIEDLIHGYQQAVDQKPVSFPGKTSSYRQWTEFLKTLAQSEEVTGDIPYWQEILSVEGETLPVDDDVVEENNTVENSAVESVRMSATETLALLQTATVNYHAGIQEILLAAFGKTLTDWSGLNQVIVDLEGHGREDLNHGLDLSRTVGWFTSIYPVLLKKSQENIDHETLLKEVKQQMRSIPHHGISYGLLRYLNNQAIAELRDDSCEQGTGKMPIPPEEIQGTGKIPIPQTPQSHPAFMQHHNEETRGEKLVNGSKAEVSFNYLGQIDNQQQNELFSLSNAPTGLGISPTEQRPYLLAVNARVQGECLQIDWSYSKCIYRQETIAYLAQRYLDNLRLYLQESSNNQSSFYISSDFGLVDLSETELDSILEDLEDLEDLEETEV